MEVVVVMEGGGGDGGGGGARIVCDGGFCRDLLYRYSDRLFTNKDMQEEFPNYFGSQIRQRHVDNDQDLEVSTTNELFALANGPSWTPTQNNDICLPGLDREMYYEDDPDIIHFDNSSDLPHSTSLNDLDNATLNIAWSKSTVVDVLPDIIDVPDKDGDIIDDEDALPYDLADSDVEDLINVDDDGVEKVYSSEEED
ncbi:hypothetical protein Tco_1261498 [Tanacetum coccineum]